jgi:carbon-monoxide dehydrogenase medium subunit
MNAVIARSAVRHHRHRHAGDPERVWTAIHQPHDQAGRPDPEVRSDPAAFEYVRADSADQAVAIIGEHGEDAKFLAGGMSLIPLMKLRLATPAVLVDVGRVRDLSYVRDGGDHIAIGALTRHRALETDDLLARQCGVLRAVAAQVGDNQVRHRGTLGGSVVHGDPASDLPAALLALDATFVARDPRGERTIAASDFFLGFLETALATDELLTEIRVPKSGATGFAYEKFNRRAQDWAIVGAVAARMNGDTHVAPGTWVRPAARAGVEAALAQGANPTDARTRPKGPSRRRT